MRKLFHFVHELVVLRFHLVRRRGAVENGEAIPKRGGLFWLNGEIQFLFSVAENCRPSGFAANKP